MIESSQKFLNADLPGNENCVESISEFSKSF